MFSDLSNVWYLSPILLTMVVFGGGLMVRLTTSAARPRRDYAYIPTVSILLPVFNEGAHVITTIRSIVECDWPADKLEIIAIDDCSNDDSYEHLLQAQAIWPQVQASRNIVNAGKHMTLVNALAKAKGEILICIDSDCIFDEAVIRELVSCFVDPEVGAVGGNIGLTNVNDNVLTVCQALVYYLTFQVGKMTQNLHGHVFCISGCLFAVRRHLFQQVEAEVKNRNWFGMRVRDGEDRYMTHAIMMRGWKTILNSNARCWTAAPNRVTQLFAQQLRWRRSALRDLFWTWVRLPRHVAVIGAFPLLMGLIPETFAVFWLFVILSTVPMFGIMAALSAVTAAFLTFSAVFMVSALGYNLSIDRLAKGSQRIERPFIAGLAGVWFFMDSLIITLVALFTFDVGAWGTRENVVKKQPS